MSGGHFFTYEVAMIRGMVDDVDPRIVLHLRLLFLYADQRLVQIEHQCLLICIKYIKSDLILECESVADISLRGDFLKYVYE